MAIELVKMVKRTIITLQPLKVKMIAKRAGQLQIKYMPAQSNVNDLRSYIKELEIID